MSSQSNKRASPATPVEETQPTEKKSRVLKPSEVPKPKVKPGPKTGVIKVKHAAEHMIGAPSIASLWAKSTAAKDQDEIMEIGTETQTDHSSSNSSSAISSSSGNANMSSTTSSALSSTTPKALPTSSACQASDSSSSSSMPTLSSSKPASSTTKTTSRSKASQSDSARAFHDAWKTDRPWLVYNESSGMWCQLCMDRHEREKKRQLSDKKETKTASVPWASAGCKTIRERAIVKHEQSSPHFTSLRESISTLSGVSIEPSWFTSEDEKNFQAIVAHFRTAYFIAKNKVLVFVLPCRDWSASCASCRIDCSRVFETS